MAQKCPSCDYPYVPNGQEVYCPNCGYKIVQPGCLATVGGIFFLIIIILMIGQCNDGNSKNIDKNSTSEIIDTAVTNDIEPSIEPSNYDNNSTNEQIIDEEPLIEDNETTEIIDSSQGF